MRYPILAVCFILSLSSLGQTATSDSLPEVRTPSGTPHGQKSEKKIGSAGGTLKSGNGKLEMVIAPNTVKSPTVFSIQPISNGLSGTNDFAFRLEPSGKKFNKPVQLIIHYDDNEKASRLDIATQDEKGNWLRLNNPTIDTVNKTITGLVPHFSDWVAFENLFISPQSARVKVNGTVNLLVDVLLTDDDILTPLGSADAGLLSPLKRKKFVVDRWSANGVTNGSAEHGTVSAAGKYAATFKAPAKVPSENPVAVTAHLQQLPYRYRGKQMLDLSVSSKVLVLDDGYVFTFTGISQSGVFHMIDSASCIISVDGKTAKLSGITNYEPLSDWPTNPDGCIYNWTNMRTWKGLVEIWGGVAEVTPTTESNPLTRVRVKLIPAYGNTPAANVSCPDHSYAIPSMPMPAQPTYISFETDGKDFFIEYMGIKGKNFIRQVKNGEGFTITVRKN